MQFDSLDGRELKDEVPSLRPKDSVRQDYHNEHNEGSGNFGIRVKVQIPEDEREEGPLGNEQEYEFIAKVNGRYDEDKQITTLQVGENPAGGGPKIEPTYDALVEALDDAVRERSDYR